MDYVYSAFISYRHLPADVAVAKAVQRALETFRIPGDIRKKTGKKKLARCFRDQDELPLADDLGASIEKALLESKWLLVICSPALPQSAWCLREVDFFIQHGRQDKIIPVLIEGEPNKSYPPQITTAEPVPEKGKVDVEPLAADLRGNMRKQLRTEKLRIVARMLNLDFYELKRRDKERALRQGLCIVSCVLAAMTGFAVYAVYKNNMLEAERNATARKATDLLIEKSVRSTSEGEMGNGLVYALQAYEGSRIFGDEYDTAVSAAMEAAMYPELFSQIGSLKDNGVLHRGASLSNDGKYVACRQADNSLQVYDSMTGERLYSIKDYGWFGRSGRDFSPDCRYICRFSDTSLTLYNSADGTEALSEELPEGFVFSCFGLTANNKVPVHREETGATALYDPFAKKLTELEGLVCDGSCKVELHRAGKLGAWSDGDILWLVDTETAQVLRTGKASTYVLTEYFTEDGWHFRYQDGEEYVYLRTDTLEEACRSEHEGSLSPDGTLLASANSSDGFTLWDAKTGEELWTEGHNSGNTLYSLAFADNDTLIASHGEVQIYRIHDRETVYDSGSDHLTYGLDFAAGRLVMPLRSGGCLINLMPEEEDVLPSLITETRESYPKDELAGMSVCLPLTGSWNGNTFYAVNADGNMVTSETEAPGLVYVFEGKTYTLHPANEVTLPYVFVSPDNKWQAMIRGEEVDIFRASEIPDPVMTIPGNGYTRLSAAFSGDTLALGSYVENLVLYDLQTGDCLGSIKTGAMCRTFQFSADGKHVIAVSSMEEQAVVASTENLAVIMRIPVTDIYAELTVGFNKDGTEAVVLYPDGHADIGFLYGSLDTLVTKAKQYTGAIE